MDNTGINQLLRHSVNLCGSVLENVMDSYGSLAQLLRELGQIFHHHFVPCMTKSRGGGLVERLLNPGCCIFNYVMDLRREVRQPVLDPRRNNCNAVGEVVRSGLQPPLLDLGGKRCQCRAGYAEQPN